MRRRAAALLATIDEKSMRRPSARTQHLIVALIAIFLFLVFDFAPALGLLVGLLVGALLPPPSPTIATRELLSLILLVVAIVVLGTFLFMGVSTWVFGPVSAPTIVPGL
jgi:hypothetical protein